MDILSEEETNLPNGQQFHFRRMARNQEQLTDWKKNPSLSFSNERKSFRSSSPKNFTPRTSLSGIGGRRSDRTLAASHASFTIDRISRAKKRNAMVCYNIVKRKA